MCESTRCSGSLLADRTQPTVTSWRLEQCTIKGDAAIYMLERGTMASVLDVAEYILKETGSMTTMKLQKLVYYSQAWSLVWDEKPLFGEPIEAWANDGPVRPCLDRLSEKRLLIPYERPRLTVVHKLLKLHCRHGPGLLENVLSYIEHRSHGSPFKHVDCSVTL